jgi:hypothetical protein
MAKSYPHRSNLETKEARIAGQKYGDGTSKLYLSQIREAYDEWMKSIGELDLFEVGNDELNQQLVNQHVQFFNDYKDILDQAIYAEKFDSRSRLHSSALEEFFTHLFKDLADASGMDIIGSIRTVNDFFLPGVGPFELKLEQKEQDFAIACSASLSLSAEVNPESINHSIELPCVIIECKTYLDKTMLGEIVTASNKLKERFPAVLHIIAAEYLKLTEDINMKKYNSIDQIYVLRREKNVDREVRLSEDYTRNNIFEETVWHLYDLVSQHLEGDSSLDINEVIERGYIFD